jgi:hypothetical protein
MNDVLTGVISTTPLNRCGRLLLGKTCLNGPGGYDCMCLNVTRSSIEVEQGEKGGTAVLLTLELDKYILDWSHIRKATELSGFDAEYTVSHKGLERGLEVVVRLPLSERANADLKEHVAESAI